MWKDVDGGPWLCPAQVSCQVHSVGMHVSRVHSTAVGSPGDMSEHCRLRISLAASGADCFELQHCVRAKWVCVSYDLHVTPQLAC